MEVDVDTETGMNKTQKGALYSTVVLLVACQGRLDRPV